MRRSYTGGANPDSLQVAVTSTGLVLTGTNMTGWPTGADGPFTVALGRGTPTEEKVLVESRTGSTLTVMAGRRGYDGTTAQAHDVGTLVEHTASAIDHDEANQHVNAATGVHGLATTDAVVGEAKTQTLENKTLDFTPGPSGSGNFISNVPLSAIPALDDAINGALPVGSVTMFAGATVPLGWLKCDGTLRNVVDFPDLAAVLGATFGGDGTATFGLPNLQGRVPVGVSSEAEFNARGKTGGAKTHTLTSGEMPTHTHAIPDHTHTQAQHTHSQSSHSHTVDPPQTNTVAGGGAHVHPTDLDEHTTDTTHVHEGLTAASAAPGGGGTTKPAQPGVVGSANSDHIHAVNIAPFTSGGTTPPALGNTTPTINAASLTPGNAGGSGAHNNLQPYLAIDFIIRALPTVV